MENLCSGGEISGKVSALDIKILTHRVLRIHLRQISPFANLTSVQSRHGRGMTFPSRTSPRFTL